MVSDEIQEYVDMLDGFSQAEFKAYMKAKERVLLAFQKIWLEAEDSSSASPKNKYLKGRFHALELISDDIVGDFNEEAHWYYQRFGIGWHK